jgi:hypothetical protein
MCDYSLHHVANRRAKIGDKLVATKFNNSITRGFSAVGQPNVAICLLPGTEIAFDENVECEPSFGIGILSNKKIGQRLARFRQVNMDNFVAHHDALEFPDGQVVLVTRLCDGQRVPRPRRRQSSSRSFASLPFRSDRADGYALIDGCNTKSHRYSRWLAIRLCYFYPRAAYLTVSPTFSI